MVILTKPCCCSNSVISFKALLWVFTLFCLTGIMICMPFNNFEKYAIKVDGSTYCGDGSYEYCQAGQWFYDMKLSVGAALLLQASIVAAGLLGDNTYLLYLAITLVFIGGGWLQMIFGTFLLTEKQNICNGSLYEATLKNSFTELCKTSNLYDYRARQECFDECENYFQLQGLFWIILCWPVALYFCTLLWAQSQNLNVLSSMKEQMKYVNF